MAFSQEVKDLTNDVIAPKIVDGVLSGNLACVRFLGTGKKWRGHNHATELKYQTSSQGGSYSGMGNFAMAVEKNTVKLTSEPKSIAYPVTVENLSVAVNKNDGIVDYLKYRMESTQQDMIDGMGTMFYGTGAGNDTDGLGNIVDDGTVAANYRGQSRTTYGALAADVTTSVGTLTLDVMAASLDAATIAAESPTVMITTPAIFSIIERLLFPTTSSSYNAQSGYPQLTRTGWAKSKAALQGQIGFNALFYRGIPIVADEKCTSGYLYYLNEKYLYWASLPHPVHGTVNLGSSTIEEINPPSKNHGICWTGLKEPVNADGQTGQFLLYGDFICDSPRHMAVDQGITG